MSKPQPTRSTRPTTERTWHTVKTRARAKNRNISKFKKSHLPSRAGAMQNKIAMLYGP